MVEINFMISDIDFDRLYAIKDKQGRNDLSGNEFARELLENELYRLCPRPSGQTEEQ